jgi:hypothetical protein
VVLACGDDHATVTAGAATNERITNAGATPYIPERLMGNPWGVVDES